MLDSHATPQTLDHPLPEYVPITPIRLLDTRPTGVTNDGRDQGTGQRAGGSTLTVQVAQLELAAAADLAASIHCIDAWGVLLETFQRSKLPACGFLLHAYAGPVEMIKPFAALGAYFSFNGSFLDPKREAQRTAFQSVPADRLLVETDAPAMPLRSQWNRYTLPTPSTGTAINHPANIAAVYAGLADFLRLRVDQLATRVEQNFTKLFAG